MAFGLNPVSYEDWGPQEFPVVEAPRSAQVAPVAYPTLEGCQELARLINLHRPEEEKKVLELLKRGLLTREEIYRPLNIQGPTWDQNPASWLEANRTKLQEITYLNLGGRGLTALPAEFKELTSLKVLQLGNNSFQKRLPDVVFTLTNLESLSFFKTNHDDLHALNKAVDSRKYQTYHEAVVELPKEIGNLAKLQYLDLRFVGLASLPTEIGQLHELRELLLKTNFISQLPKEIGQLTNLERVHFGENPWQSLPDELSQLQKLKHVDFDEVVRPGKWISIGIVDNQDKFDALMGQLAQLPNLKFVDIVKNELKEFPEALAKILPTLDKVACGKNDGMGVSHVPAEFHSKLVAE